MDRIRFPSAATLGMAMLVGCGLAAPPAQAGYVVTLTQEGVTSSRPEAAQSI